MHTEEAEGVRRVSTPMPGRPPQVNAYLLAVGDGRWALVDGGVGTAEAWDALDAAVREAGGWRRIAVQVVTHMHMDHVGLAARAREASGAPVAMGRLDAERMRHAAADPGDEAAYRAALLRRAGAPPAWTAEVEAGRARSAALAPPVEVAVELDGREGELPGVPGWRFVWTPGHTAGHVSLFRPADRTLVAGDAVLPRVTPTLGVNRQRKDPVGDYLGALDALEGLDPARVLPGHGEALANGAGRIRALRAAAKGETEAVRALLVEAGRSCWEVVEARYAGRALPPPTRMLALRETLAHLERLAATGAARAEEGTDGTVRFVAGEAGASLPDPH